MMILEIAQLADRKLGSARQGAQATLALWRKSLDTADAYAKLAPDKFQPTTVGRQQLDASLSKLNSMDYLSVLEVDREAAAQRRGMYAAILDGLGHALDILDRQPETKEQLLALTTEQDNRLSRAHLAMKEGRPTMFIGVAIGAILLLIGAVGCLRWASVILGVIVLAATCLRFFLKMKQYQREQASATGPDGQGTAKLKSELNESETRYQKLREAIDSVGKEFAVANDSMKKLPQTTASPDRHENYPPYYKNVRQSGSLTVDNLLADFGELLYPNVGFSDCCLDSTNILGSFLDSLLEAFERDEANGVEMLDENEESNVKRRQRDKIVALRGPVRERMAQLTNGSQEWLILKAFQELVKFANRHATAAFENKEHDAETVIPSLFKLESLHKRLFRIVDDAARRSLEVRMQAGIEECREQLKSYTSSPLVFPQGNRRQ